jgi:hypothetical protein
MTKLAIAIDLDQLRALMREFIDERKEYGEQTETELTFGLFLQWVKKQQEQVAPCWLCHQKHLPNVSSCRRNAIMKETSNQ